LSLVRRLPFRAKRRIIPVRRRSLSLNKNRHHLDALLPFYDSTADRGLAQKSRRRLDQM